MTASSDHENEPQAGNSTPQAMWMPGEAGVLASGTAERARQQRERYKRYRDPRSAIDAEPSLEAELAEPFLEQPIPESEEAPALDGSSAKSSVARQARVPQRSGRRSLGTAVVHAGLEKPRQSQPFLPGPVFAAPFHASGDPSQIQYSYGRHGNPGFDRYEEALGKLDGGHAVVFSSGMAATAAVLQHLLGPGDLLVAPHDGYPGVVQIAKEHLASRGVGVRLVASTTDAILRAAKAATLVWIETPTNPGLDVVELEHTIEACKREGARVVVDNTLATPLRQCPLALGADIVVSSDSKHLTGHSDLVLGHVSCADKELAQQLTDWRTMVGSIPGPFEVWLAHRSLATLEVRLERQEEVADALVAALAEREEVTDLRYPGYGSVLGFDLETERKANAFLRALDLVTEATSFGGVHSSAERRARWATDDISPGWIRFSTGIEGPEDVVSDVLQALARSR